MADLNLVCEHCRSAIDALIAADPRPSVTISGDLAWGECCFVRDEIRFLNNGRLIFEPRRNEEYCREYFVVCRKLVIVGGGPPITLNPCGPEDPGNIYKNKNAITWRHRLEVEPTAVPNPFTAADGQSFAQWQDQGQGNSGRTGGAGADGNPGSAGRAGRDAPDFTLIALEVEFLNLDAHLIIDFDGQVGGTGGRGQNGGKGGKGMNGREGSSDTSWPGTGCDRQPGHGGDGGVGGDGGPGGRGGDGGDAGDITVITSRDNISAGIFVGGKFTFVNDGGNEGAGGLGGFGGAGGGGGSAGFKSSECDAADNGQGGDAGFPPVSLGAGSTANQGPHGGAGSPGSLAFLEISDPLCIANLPLPVQVAAVDPPVLCRGFSTPANNVPVSVTGANLAQVSSVAVGLAGVTAAILPSSTDTDLALRFDILGNSALGQGSLTLQRAVGAPHVLANAIEVKRFEVLAVSPTSVARGAEGVLTITGQCFDPGAAIQQVNISGFGVTVPTVAVLDSTTVQCTVQVGAAAALGARNVTVKTGALQHTLVNALTVTS